jgi:hypothetical protein
MRGAAKPHGIRLRTLSPHIPHKIIERHIYLFRLMALIAITDPIKDTNHLIGVIIEGTGERDKKPESRLLSVLSINQPRSNQRTEP